MKTLRSLLIIIAGALAAAGALTSCIEDGFTTSPADQPVFSTDTVDLGDLFTLGASPTARFTVYNRHDKGITLQSVRFTDNPDGIFRLNVDGMSGRDFSGVDIRANDSIFVFVEATLPENGRDLPVECFAHLEFMVNGVSSTVVVRANGQDVTRLKGDYRIASDATLSATKPYQVYDSIVVEKGARLTIPAGARLYFHDKARMVVHGTLDVAGSADAPVQMTGDRTGFVAADIPYEVMSGQWEGIHFTETSSDNRIEHASIRNTRYGLLVDNVPYTPDTPSLRLINSVVRNSQGFILETANSSVEAIGCELADASSGLVYLYGGTHRFNHCTLANYYLFSAAGPAVNLDHTGAGGADDPDKENPLLSAEFANCILYGNGSEVAHYIPQPNDGMKVDSDIEGVDIIFRRCLFKANGEDDAQFVNSIWGEDPLFYTERENYIFDYRLRPESPALHTADPMLTLPEAAATDLYGTPRTSTPSVGAYESRPE